MTLYVILAPYTHHHQELTNDDSGNQFILFLYDLKNVWCHILFQFNTSALGKRLLCENCNCKHNNITSEWLMHKNLRRQLNTPS